MKVIDLTHVMTADMPVYPGTEPPQFRPANSYEKDGFRETLLSMFTHTGTHMDPPAHLFAGRTTLDQFPPDQFIGKALVIDCGDIPEGVPVPEMVFTASSLAVRERFGSCGEEEAKACAYILSGYLQIELPEACAQSVFSWAKGRERKEVSVLMQKVQKTAKEVIKKMEQEDF